jgi:hypothetical protein
MNYTHPMVTADKGTITILLDSTWVATLVVMANNSVVSILAAIYWPAIEGLTKMVGDLGI